MWGYSIPFWEAVFRWSTIAAFVLGGAGVTAAFISTWVGAKLGDVSQNEFNLKLEAAKVEVASANARAGAAEERAAQANVTAANLEKDAAVARLEQERLKQQLAWREVTPHQAEAIRNTLKKANLQITIFWIAGDAEGSAFARRLAEALLSAGSTISGFAPTGMLGAEKHGLSISGSEKEECELLATALRAAGFGEIPIDLSQRKPDGSKFFTGLLELDRRQITGTSWQSDDPAAPWHLANSFSDLSPGGVVGPRSAQLFFGSDGLAIVRLTFETDKSETGLLVVSNFALWTLEDEEIRIFSIPQHLPMLKFNRKAFRDLLQSFNDVPKAFKVNVEADLAKGPRVEFRRLGLGQISN